MARYWVIGGVSTNWSDTLNWALTSGGIGGQAVPTSTDDVFFDAGGNGPCVLNTAVTKSAKTLTIDNAYTSTMTFNVTLGMSGAVVLSSAMTIAGASLIIMGVSANFTSNGTAMTTSGIQLNNVTVTLQDNCTFLTVSGNVGGNVLNGFTAHITNLNGTQSISGSTNFIFDGATGAWNNSAAVQNNVTFNSAGIITLGASTTWGGTTTTLLYTAGNMSVGTNTMSLSASSGQTWNTSGMTWNNIGHGATTETINLASDLVMSGNFASTLTTQTLTVNGAFNFKIGGNITLNSMSTGSIAGTSTMVATGFGTLSMSAVTTGSIRIAIFEVNAASSLTLSGTINFSTNIWKQTSAAATLITTGSTLVLLVDGVTITNNSTSALAFNHITTTVNTTFNGSAGFVIGGTLTNNTAGKTITLAATKTYAVNGSLVLNGTNASHGAIVSSSGGSQALLTLGASATQVVSFINATDIDSSGGKTIFDFDGTLSNTVNWNAFSTPVTTSYTWVS